MGRLIFTSVCMCLVKGSGQLISCRHSFVPSHIPKTIKTDYEGLGQEIKRGTWTLLISNLIWLCGACGCMTLFVFCVWADQRSDRSLTVVYGAQDFRMQHQTWQLGEKVDLCSRQGSSCNFDFPILGHQPKTRRELLQAKATGPHLCWIKRTEGEISWGRMTLLYTSTHFWMGLSNALCVTEALYSVVQSFQYLHWILINLYITTL